eukprot:PhM_4_TR2026/c0_g1_i1/m.70709
MTCSKCCAMEKRRRRTTLSALCCANWSGTTAISLHSWRTKVARIMTYCLSVHRCTADCTKRNATQKNSGVVTTPRQTPAKQQQNEQESVVAVIPDDDVRSELLALRRHVQDLATRTYHATTTGVHPILGVIVEYHDLEVDALLRLISSRASESAPEWRVLYEGQRVHVTKLQKSAAALVVSGQSSPTSLSNHVPPDSDVWAIVQELNVMKKQAAQGSGNNSGSFHDKEVELLRALVIDTHSAMCTGAGDGDRLGRRWRELYEAQTRHVKDLERGGVVAAVGQHTTAVDTLRREMTDAINDVKADLSALREDVNARWEPLRQRVLVKNSMTLRGFEEVLGVHEAEVVMLMRQLDASHKVILSLLAGFGHDKGPRRQQLYEDYRDHSQYPTLYQAQLAHVRNLERRLDEAMTKQKTNNKNDSAAIVQQMVHNVGTWKAEVVRELQDIQTRLRGLASSRHPAQVPALYNEVVDYLHRQLTVTLRLCQQPNETATTTSSSTEWRDLYASQQTHMKELHREATRMPTTTAFDTTNNNTNSNHEGFMNDAALLALQQFCSTTQRELEQERQEWRTRCIGAEAQLREMESRLQHLEKDNQRLRRSQQT